MTHAMIRAGAGAALLFAGSALPLAAQDDFVMYLDRPEACDLTQDRDYEVRPFDAIHEGEATVLSVFGMEALEYSCEFAEEIVFDWSESTIQTRVGYCAEPGDYVYPKVFAIGMSSSEPDVVLVWESDDLSGNATRFTACRQY